MLRHLKFWLCFALMAFAMGASAFVPSFQCLEQTDEVFPMIGNPRATETFVYDVLGNRSGFYNADGKPITFGFDEQGRVTAITNALDKVTSFEYDDVGNLTNRQDAKTQSTHYDYDALNHLTNIVHESTWKASFEYDPNGNVTNSHSPLVTCHFAYDEMNRLKVSTQSVYSVSSVVQNSYDLNGNRTNIVYPGGLTVSYEFGADNRLESVTTKITNDTKTVSFGYDTANRLDSISYPNGVNSTFGLDTEGRVTNIVYGTFVNRQIIRNPLGFKTTEMINAGLAPTVPNTVRSLKTHNEADQIVSERVQTGSTNWSDVAYYYNDNGGLEHTTTDTLLTQSFTYDYDNRLIETTKDTKNTKYVYDASGARISRITNNSITNYFIIDYVDGLKRPLAETDASGSVTRWYVWSGAQLLCHIEADGDVFYYHADELGSTLALTDSAGTVTDQFAYMPYGYATHTGATQTPYLWLGGYGVYYDADTALHLTLHRAYSSSLKRFLSPDPLGIDGGVNVYAMANLNPLFFVDPYGLSGLESVGSYLSDSWEQVWKGNYTDNVTALGTAGQIGTGLLGIDLPGDIRDLTYDVQNWEWSWGHAGQTALDAVGLLPVIGALKYADEGATLLKHADDVPSSGKIFTPHGTAIQDLGSDAQSALRKVEGGSTVYRQGEFDIQNTGDAQFWALDNPATTPGYAGQMGMPGSSSPQVDWMIGGKVQSGQSVITRPAPGIGVNDGGKIEAVVNPGGVQLDWFHMP